MLSTIVTITFSLLALALIGFVFLPLLSPKTAGAPTSEGDPVEQELAEERDALLRAIHELEARTDLSVERRQQLRARYEAKAARVLRTIDEHRASPEPLERVRRPRPLPLSVLLLLALMVPSVALIGNYLLPRIGGASATVTTNDQRLLELGRNLKRLEQAAQRSPSENNLLALGEAYWQIVNSNLNQQDRNASEDEELRTFLESARATYQRIEEEIRPVPAVAYQRLGFLALMESNSEEGLSYLELARDADPENLDTLFALGETYYFLGRMDEATSAWKSFLAAPGGSEEQDLVAPRLEAARTLAPLTAQADEAPTEANLMALADAYWNLEDTNRAANLYLHVLTELEVQNPKAIQRLGMAMFFSGDNEQAALALETARALEPQSLETLLFLGNTYFSMNQLERAIDVWEDYVTTAGGQAKAGRVPDLIAQAKARLAGDTPAATGSPPATLEASPETNVSAEELFASNCASCHGASAQGGVAPRLAGNGRLTNAEMVRGTILNGRGMMPGFGDLLTGTEIEALTDYVIQRASP